MECAGQILTPIVVDCRCRAVRVGDALFDKVPIVVEECGRSLLRDLLDMAGFRVVKVREDNPVNRECLEAVGGIIGESSGGVVREHLAVGVVVEIGVRDVLVERVGRPVR